MQCPNRATHASIAAVQSTGTLENAELLNDRSKRQPPLSFRRSPVSRICRPLVARAVPGSARSFARSGTSRYHRNLLRYHVAPFSDQNQQISKGRSILEFVADNCPSQSVHGRVFRSERDYLRTVRDDYFFHEYSVEEKSPLYFHEFVAQAENERLQFVSDAEFSKMSATFTSAEVQRVIANTPLVQRCQFLDHLYNTSFHRTLLCHSNVGLQLNWTPKNPLFASLSFPSFGSCQTSWQGANAKSNSC